MRRTVLLIPILSLLIVAGCSRQDSIVVATDPNLPPFSYTASSRTDYRGIDIEIAEKIAEELDSELLFEGMDSERLLDAVREGRADMAIAKIPIKRELVEGIRFSLPYYEASTAAVCLDSTTSFRRKEDLAEKAIAIVEGSSVREVAQRYSSEILTFPSHLEMIETLRAGEFMVCMVEEQAAQSLSRSNSDLQILPFTFPLEFYGIAVGKEDEKLLESINAVLGEMKATGEYQRLIRKYLR